MNESNQIGPNPNPALIFAVSQQGKEFRCDKTFSNRFSGYETAALLPFEKATGPVAASEGAGSTAATLVSAGTKLGYGYQGKNFPAKPDGATETELSIARDITERKHTEKALRESEVSLQCLVEQAADAFFIVDSEAKIVNVNRRACHSLGFASGAAGFISARY